MPHAQQKAVLSNFRLLFVLPVFFYSATALAQGFSVQFNGYAKNLGIWSTTILTSEVAPKERYFLNISRFRAKGLLDLSHFLHAEIWLDNELLTGDFLETFDFQFGESLQRPTFADLEWKVKQGRRYRLQQSFFRAFATLYLKNIELTIGRQRIAWGTGYVWNPTDLLNPFNPAAVELDEKQGVDAAYLVVPLGSLSRIEGVYAPGRKQLQSSAAFRVSSHLGEYDFSIMAGDFQSDKVLGGDFAGYLGGAGLRGEFTFTWKKAGDNFFRAILNADYNFSHDIYVFAELYFNGQGRTNKKNYEVADLFSGQTFNLARHYLALSGNKNLTPLLALSFYSIMNLNDRSCLLGPALTYSLATNLEVTASAYFFMGANDSEYGLLENSYFAYMQYYF
ncbi:MAG: hypothetical protein ACE5HS_21970 [bacterium]